MSRDLFRSLIEGIFQAQSCQNGCHQSALHVLTLDSCSYANNLFVCWAAGGKKSVHPTSKANRCHKPVQMCSLKSTGWSGKTPASKLQTAVEGAGFDEAASSAMETQASDQRQELSSCLLSQALYVKMRARLARSFLQMLAFLKNSQPRYFQAQRAEESRCNSQANFAILQPCSATNRGKSKRHRFAQFPGRARVEGLVARICRQPPAQIREPGKNQKVPSERSEAGVRQPVALVPAGAMYVRKDFLMTGGEFSVQDAEAMRGGGLEAQAWVCWIRLFGM